MIRDQGIGIPQEEQKNLFSRFYRVKNDTTQKIKGTGLGLYLSRYFIEAHRGTLEVESEPNHGTCFRIKLPLNLSEAELPQPGLKTGDFNGKAQSKENTHA